MEKICPDVFNWEVVRTMVYLHRIVSLDGWIQLNNSLCK